MVTPAPLVVARPIRGVFLRLQHFYQATDQRRPNVGVAECFLDFLRSTTRTEGRHGDASYARVSHQNQAEPTVAAPSSDGRLFGRGAAIPRYRPLNPHPLSFFVVGRVATEPVSSLPQKSHRTPWPLCGRDVPEQRGADEDERPHFGR